MVQNLQIDSKPYHLRADEERLYRNAAFFCIERREKNRTIFTCSASLALSPLLLPEALSPNPATGQRRGEEESPEEEEAEARYFRVGEKSSGGLSLSSSFDALALERGEERRSKQPEEEEEEESGESRSPVSKAERTVAAEAGW